MYIYHRYTVYIYIFAESPFTTLVHESSTVSCPQPPPSLDHLRLERSGGPASEPVTL